MPDAISMDDQIAAVERAAQGIHTADLRRERRCLIAAAASLARMREQARPVLVSDARVGASFDRSRTP